MRPISIPQHIKTILASSQSQQQQILSIQENYQKLTKNYQPIVSIIIPAFNEEKNILTTLLSLSRNKTKWPVEIIVVNNNSSDNTEQLVKATGVTCILEERKGITAARNAGLKAAKGNYILNADADAIYPVQWIESMIQPLVYDHNVALTYGRFSFIPVGATSRLMYFFYEHAADVQRFIFKYFKEEAVNVYGFNSAFRRREGLMVQGYDHPPGTNEDGYLALKLRNKGFGRLQYVTKINALVWTTDRRIEMEGGFLKGVKKRILKFIFPQSFVQVRTDL